MALLTKQASPVPVRKRHHRSMQTSRFQDSPSENKVPRKVNFKHARTTKWCLHKIRIISHASSTTWVANCLQLATRAGSTIHESLLSPWLLQRSGHSSRYCCNPSSMEDSTHAAAVDVSQESKPTAHLTLKTKVQSAEVFTPVNCHSDNTARDATRIRRRLVSNRESGCWSCTR